MRHTKHLKNIERHCRQFGWSVSCPMLSLSHISPTCLTFSLPLFSLMSCCPSPILYGNYKIFIVCVCFVRGKSWGSQARVLCNVSHTHTHTHEILHTNTRIRYHCACVCTCRNLSAWKTTNEKSNFLSFLRCCSSRCCLRAIIARDDRNKRKLKFSCPAQYTPNPPYPFFLLVSASPQPFSCCPLCCAVPRRVRFNFVAVSPCRIFWLGLYVPPSALPCPLLLCGFFPLCSASLLRLTFCAVCALLSTFCHFICSVKYFGPLPNVFPLLLLPSSSVLFLFCLLSCVVADAFATFAFAIRICRCSWGQLVIKRENISLIIVGQLLECAPKAKETKRGTKQPKKTVKVAQRDSPANGDTFILLFSLLLLLFFSSSAFEHRCFSFWRSSCLLFLLQLLPLCQISLAVCRN